MYHGEAGAGPKQLQPAWAPGARRGVPRTVVWIGLVSLLTDVSSEMVASILPLYLFMVLRLSPLEYGWIDGLFNGAAAVVRVWFAHWADRTRHYKRVAFLGYAMSALSRLGMFIAGLGGWASVAVVLLLDRFGKGIRTAPRDAMIALSCQHPAASAGTATPPAAPAAPTSPFPAAGAAAAAAASASSEGPGGGAARGSSLGAAFGVHRAMDACGALAGPLVAAGLLWAAPGRFDFVFAVSLVFALAGLFVLWRFVQLPAGTDAGAASETVPPVAQRVPLGQLWQPLRRAPYVWLCVACAMLSTFTVSDGMFYAGLQAREALPPSALPLMFVATAAVFMLTAMPVGRLADRLGSMRVFFAAHGLLVALYALVGWQSLPGWLALGLAALLLGLYYAGTDGVVMAWLARGLPADVRTTGMALVTSVIGVARLGASVLFGWCWTVWSYEAALWCFAGGMLAGLGLLLYAAWRWPGQWPR